MLATLLSGNWFVCFNGWGFNINLCAKGLHYFHQHCGSRNLKYCFNAIKRWVIISSAQIFHCVKKVTPGLTVSVAKHMLVQRNWYENRMIQLSFACPWTVNNHVRILLKCFVFAVFSSFMSPSLLFPWLVTGPLFSFSYTFSVLLNIPCKHCIVMLTQFHQFTSTKIIVDIDLTFPFQFRKSTAGNNVVAA